MTDKKKVIIIGRGPAGISAALYTTRGGLDTTIIAKDNGALEKAEKIENFYGFENPVSANELLNNGINGAKRLGTKFIDDEVLSISYTDSLTVITKAHEYKADFVLIATGVNRAAPNIKGLKEFEGKGVSYCAVCDAFFYKGLDVGVIGNGSYALHEASALSGIAKSVTILTDGKEISKDVSIPPQFNVNNKKISEILGDNKVSSVTFEDNTSLSLSGIFVAVGIAGSADLARKIGASVDGKNIVVDKNMQTTIPFLYSAGDCTGGLLQISKAVYEGALAATDIIKKSKM